MNKITLEQYTALKIYLFGEVGEIERLSFARYLLNRNLFSLFNIGSPLRQLNYKGFGYCKSVWGI